MPVSMARWCWVVGVLVAAAPGCHKAWRTSTMTPPITLGANLDARTSLPAVILLRDMDLPATMWLPNTVYFVAVSKDRVRFHVALMHKWEDMSDPTRWRVWLEDDRGARIAPAGLDRRAVRPVTKMYDLSPYSIDLRPLYAITVYRGVGDYVFYRRNLVRRGMRSLTLVMSRPGYEYRYRWDFVGGSHEQVAEPVQLSHCGSVEETCRPIAAPPTL